MALPQNFINFSNELAPVFLDAYDSWGKFSTMIVTSGTVIISVIYKKCGKKDIANYRPYTTILKNPLQKALDTVCQIKSIKTFHSVDGIMSFLLCKTSHMETNLFI